MSQLAVGAESLSATGIWDPVYYVRSASQDAIAATPHARYRVCMRVLSAVLGSAYPRPTPAERENTDACTTASSADDSVRTRRGLQILDELYQFRDHAEVTAFLQEHSFLVDILLGGYSQVQTHFGWNTPIALEVYIDPEGIGESELFALILTDSSPSDALDSLHRLDEQWWLDAAPESRCLLNFDVEFI